MSTQQELPLPSSAPSQTTIVNGRCSLRQEGDYHVVVVAGLPVHHYSSGDTVAEAYAMVFLMNGGYATQKEVARAFKCCERTVRRHQKRYHDGGMTALATQCGWRVGRRRIPKRRRHVIDRMKTEGLSNREIARRLGTCESAIRKQVAPSQTDGPLQGLLGFAQADERFSVNRSRPISVASVDAPQRMPANAPERTPIQSSVPDSTRAELTLAAGTLDSDPSNRCWDRLLACLGLLDDAAPVFGDVQAVPGAGVLLAVPLLVASGLFRIAASLYGEIGPAFYGLRTTLLALLLMALWRIKRSEGLKERDPQALGSVLGLDRTPEVKTLRRKLSRLASYHKAERLGAELARFRIEQRGRAMGFLYVDGHVRVYYGKRSIPKTHVARMRLSMPATTDYWINDQLGDPLFVVTASANAGMVKMLPQLLAQVRELVGDRRVTIVFDRGGWSPALFQRLLEANFDILTYRKGKGRRIAAHRFSLRSACFEGHTVEYQLHDQPVRFLKGKLRLRQVTRLGDDDHQTCVITSRWDLPDIEVAYRMFERWRQENFFKYLREEFLLDALVDYQLEPDDPTRLIPNPERRSLDKEVLKARSEVARLEQAYGAAAADNPEGRRPTMRGFKIAHGDIGRQLREARTRLAQLREQRRALPQRVEIRQVGDDAVIKLATERKHLTNLIKMLAYQAESDLLTLLRPHYARSDDEGRTLLHELFANRGDIEAINSELRVTVRPMSSPHRTAAVRTLCEILTDTCTCFPGSSLVMRFAVSASPKPCMAFPGPRQAPPRAPASQGSGRLQPDILRKG